MKVLLLSVLIFMILTACNQQGANESPSSVVKVDSTQQKGISAVTACLLSEIVYCKDPQKQMDQYMPGWKIVWNPAAVGGNYAFVATDGNYYALAIRGSLIEFSWAAFDNWIYNDLNIAYQKDWPYCSSGQTAKISQGAYAGWENMNKMTDKTSRKSLWSFLQANAMNKSITITGHSLGGNLATVYASYLWKKFKDSGHPKNNINVITFAAPAAGNKTFAEDFNAEFPNSSRVENINDIVPKFPVSDKVADLGILYSPTPAASDIMVGYQNATVSLSRVFITVSAALDLLRITNGISPYTQTNGLGDLIKIKLSGKDTTNEATSWFAEAGYQHGVDHYAEALGVPVVKEQ